MPIWTKSTAYARRIDVLLFERFSNHCLANAVEPLRAANELAHRRLYTWRHLTIGGRPVTSSSGLLVDPEAALRDGSYGDYLFVLPSYGHRRLATPECLSALRVAASRYTVLAGLDTGSWLLAEAGLLSGRRATIHWDEFDGFAERFPEVEALHERFVIDGNRISCGGAMATFDLVTQLIADDHGEALRIEIDQLFLHENRAARIHEIAGKSGVVRQAVRLMREHLETAITIEELARRTGRTQRNLEQLFRRELGAAPRAVYRRLRLLAVRRLLENTAMPVSEVAIRCGYSDPSAMARAFKAEFGLSPRSVRTSGGRAPMEGRGRG